MTLDFRAQLTGVVDTEFSDDMLDEIEDLAVVYHGSYALGALAGKYANGDIAAGQFLFGKMRLTQMDFEEADALVEILAAVSAQIARLTLPRIVDQQSPDIGYRGETQYEDEGVKPIARRTFDKAAYYDQCLADFAECYVPGIDDLTLVEYARFGYIDRSDQAEPSTSMAAMLADLVDMWIVQDIRELGLSDVVRFYWAYVLGCIKGDHEVGRIDLIAHAALMQGLESHCDENRSTIEAAAGDAPG